MGVNTTELWCNLGLCCFYASQYDMALSCLDKALSSERRTLPRGWAETAEHPLSKGSPVP